MKNSIIDEVRAARAALAEEHGYDREKILAWARRKQTEIKSSQHQEAKVSAKVPAATEEQRSSTSH